MSERTPDITTDASYLALLKHIRNKLAAKVEALPPGHDQRSVRGEDDGEQAKQLEALAGYIEEVQWK